MNSGDFEAIAKHSVTVAEFEFNTGIFPSEMAYVLTAIEKNEVDFVIDSGRGPDAFSLLCLQSYQKNSKKKIKVFSLDIESAEDKHFFKHFSNNPDVVLKEGNSFDDIPEIYRCNGEKDWAVIIDGPKHKDQILLSLLVIKHISPKVLALHNSPPGSLQQQILDSNLSGRYYENFQFKEKEFTQLLSLDVTRSRRSLEQSSLLLFCNPTLPSKIPLKLWMEFRVCSFFWTLKIRIKGFGLLYNWIVRLPRMLLWTMPFAKSKGQTFLRSIKKSFNLLLYPTYKRLKRTLEK
jgi:hypothetical protein